LPALLLLLLFLEDPQAAKLTASKPAITVPSIFLLVFVNVHPP
jgi:hypothetical protein